MSKRKAPEDLEKTGAKTKYDPSFDELAYNYCLLGATDAQLANFFGVTEQTVNNWKIAQPTFFESLKKGKSMADAMVAKSLFGRATGYEHPEDKIFNNNGEPMIVPTVKHYPPDPTAAIFWLKNRQPDKWRDKQDISLGNTDGQPFKTESQIVFNPVGSND